MGELNDLMVLPDDFSGRVRLFPLPNLVLFPGVMQPLHIFEPRYRAMLEAALASDGLIAMSVLLDGWQQDYEGRPPMSPIACLGKVVTHHRQDDGRYNILLVGIRRVRIDAELPPEQPFREAQIQILDDEYPQENAANRAALQRRLVNTFKRVMPQSTDAHEQLSQLLGNGVSLGALCDIIAYTLNLPLPLKLRLLGETNVDVRAMLLVNHLRGGSKSPAVAAPTASPAGMAPAAAAPMSSAAASSTTTSAAGNGEPCDDFLPRFSLN